MTSPQQPEPAQQAEPVQPPDAAEQAEPPQAAQPPPGGPTDPRDRTVTPIAHPTVVLPPNPIPRPRFGLPEIVIVLLGAIVLASTFLPWAPGSSAWDIGYWAGGVLSALAVLLHLGRFVPSEWREAEALIPLALGTGGAWVALAALGQHHHGVGTWVCLVAGLLLTAALLGAAVRDLTLARPGQR
jgi:hypothetical protein